jgi:hypothetical protein
MLTDIYIYIYIYICVCVCVCVCVCMELSTIREAISCEASQEISQHVMEPESSLLCSQDLSTGPYSEPDKSSPYHCILHF